MTGRYPMRCGHPISRHYTAKYESYALAPDEVTIAEQMKKAGFYNAMIGKWHLGFEVAGSHPLDAGFDEYYGMKGNYTTDYPIYRNREGEQSGVPFNQVTQLYTKEAIKFIEKEHKQPFFLYFSHHIAHTPIDPNPEFKGKTKRGKYADFVYELDDSVAQVVQAVEKKGISENTLIVFLSDNGPANTGSAKPLSGGKYVTMEGGMRVPGIFYWPGKIPSRQVSDALITSMDLLPLFSALAQVELPKKVTLDGKDIWDLLTGDTNQSPHSYFHYYNGLNLQAVRNERWKLHFPRTTQDQPYWAKKMGGNKKKRFTTLDHPVLYDLDSDLNEQINVYAENPEIVKELMKEATRIRQEIGDINVIGTDQRPHGLKKPNEK